MKTILSILLCFCFNAFFAQTHITKNSNVDSIVMSHLGDFSIQTGNALLVSDSGTNAILFFEKLFLDSIDFDKNSNAPQIDLTFSPRHSASLFQLVYFDEESNSIQKRTIDTLDYNLGWSGCHFTDIVDSAALLKHGDTTSVLLLMCHPVLFSCNSMTHYYMKSYSFSLKSGVHHITNDRIAETGFYTREKNWRQKAFDKLSLR